MPVTMILKARDNKREAILTPENVAAIVAQNNPQAAYQWLSDMLNQMMMFPEKVHDVEHLTWLVNWGIQTQKPYVEQQKYDRIAARIGAVDETRGDCEFTFTDYQAQLIYDRLKDESFTAPNRLFYEWARDFRDALREQKGTMFETLDPGGDEGFEVIYLQEPDDYN